MGLVGTPALGDCSARLSIARHGLQKLMGCIVGISLLTSIKLQQVLTILCTEVYRSFALEFAESFPTHPAMFPKLLLVKFHPVHLNFVVFGSYVLIFRKIVHSFLLFI